MESAINTIIYQWYGSFGPSKIIREELKSQEKYCGGHEQVLYHSLKKARESNPDSEIQFLYSSKLVSQEEIDLYINPLKEQGIVVLDIASQEFNKRYPVTFKFINDIHAYQRLKMHRTGKEEWIRHENGEISREQVYTAALKSIEDDLSLFTEEERKIIKDIINPDIEPEEVIPQIEDDILEALSFAYDDKETTMTEEVTSSEKEKFEDFSGAEYYYAHNWIDLGTFKDALIACILHHERHEMGIIISTFDIDCYPYIDISSLYKENTVYIVHNDEHHKKTVGMYDFYEMFADFCSKRIGQDTPLPLDIKVFHQKITKCIRLNDFRNLLASYTRFIIYEQLSQNKRLSMAIDEKGLFCYINGDINSRHQYNALPSQFTNASATILAAMKKNDEKKLPKLSLTSASSTCNMKSEPRKC